MTETDLPYQALPAAVKSAFESSEYAKWKVDDVDMLERPDMEKVYVIEVESGKQEFDLYYSEEGILVKSVADTDNDSENYLPAEIPAAIETFIKKQYPNARLVEIEVEHGMTEVDIIDGNISKEIVFNSSNEWISTSWDVRRNELPETVPVRSLLQRNMRDIKSMTQTLLKHPKENIIWLNWKKENWK